VLWEVSIEWLHVYLMWYVEGEWSEEFSPKRTKELDVRVLSACYRAERWYRSKEVNCLQQLSSYV